MWSCSSRRVSPRRRHLRALGFALLVSLTLLSSGCRQQQVPDLRMPVVGQPHLTAAIEKLRAAGFAVALVDTPVAASEYWGKVCNQRPSPGRPMREGDLITLAVAVNPASRPWSYAPAKTHARVPEVVGLDHEAAASLVRGAGLIPVLGYVDTYDSLEFGQTVNSLPPPGTELRVGSNAVLQVGRRPGPFKAVWSQQNLIILFIIAVIAVIVALLVRKRRKRRSVLAEVVNPVENAQQTLQPDDAKGETKTEPFLQDVALLGADIGNLMNELARRNTKIAETVRGLGKALEGLGAEVERARKIKAALPVDAERGEAKKPSVAPIEAEPDEIIRAYNTAPETFVETFLPVRVGMKGPSNINPEFEEQESGVFLIVESGDAILLFPHFGVNSAYLWQIKSCFDIREVEGTGEFQIREIEKGAFCERNLTGWNLKTKGALVIER